MKTSDLKLKRYSDRIERTLKLAGYNSEPLYYYGKNEFGDINIDEHSVILNREIYMTAKLDNMKRSLGEYEFTADRPFIYTAYNFLDYEVTDIYYLYVDFWESKMIAVNNFYIEDENGEKYDAQFCFGLRGLSLAVKATVSARGKKVFRLIPQKQISADSVKKNLCLAKNFISDFINKNYRFKGKYYSAYSDLNGICEVKFNGKEFICGNIKLLNYENGLKFDSVLEKVVLKNSGRHLCELEFRYKSDLETVKEESIVYTFYKDINRLDIKVDIIKDCSKKSGKTELYIPFSSLIMLNENNVPVFSDEDILRGIGIKCGNDIYACASYDCESVKANNNSLIFTLSENIPENGFTDAEISEYCFSLMKVQTDLTNALDNLDVLNICVRGEYNEF